MIEEECNSVIAVLMGVETVKNFKKTFNVGHGMERQDAKDWWVFMIPGIIVFVSWDDRFRITRENINSSF